MKRVLIVAGIREAFTRVFPLGAYLPEFGWEATVLTPVLSPAELTSMAASPRFLEQAHLVPVAYPGDVFRTWRRLLRAVGFRSGESLTEQLKVRTGLVGRASAIDVLFRWYQTLFAYPDAERTWRAPALRASEAILRSGGVDAIISSSPFPTAHLVASALKRHHLPWLADFRDPWTRNHNYIYRSLRRLAEERLERFVLRQADVLTAASPAYARKQEALHGRRAHAVPIGFDPDAVNNPPAALTRNFTLTYTGTIYSGKQDPEKLLNAVRGLLGRGALPPGEIEVRFYGSRLAWLDRRIAELGLSGTVTQHGPVSRSNAIARQRESQVLLLFNWEDASERDVYPLKLFEYLAARRPVLSTGGFSPDGVETILNSAEGGIYATSADAIERAILRFYEDYRLRGAVGYRGRLSAVMEYDHRHVARRFAQLLDQAGGRYR